MRSSNDDNQRIFRATRTRCLALCFLAPLACDGVEELDDMELDSEGLEDDFELEDGQELDIIEEQDPNDIDDGYDIDIDIDLEAELDPLAIGAQGYASWGTPGNNGAPLDLGLSDGRTCFLQGVSGQLRAPQWAPFATQASVSVFQKDGHWWLRTKAGDGAGAMGQATCIPTDTNQRTFSWQGNSFNSQNAKSIAAGLFTRCFLTSVSGTTGWGSPNSHTRLWKQGGNWWLGGNLIKHQDGTSGGGSAAVCVDIWQTSGTYSWQAGNNHPGATATLTTQADVVCSIHQLIGNFAHDSTGWLDGARLFPQFGFWKAFSSNGKGIRGECINNINWGF